MTSEKVFQNEYGVLNPTEVIAGCRLYMTCSACPEQYDVFKQGEQIGYLRLRHGEFSAWYLDHTGKCVYRANPMGDGIFQEQERTYYLTKAVLALLHADIPPIEDADQKEWFDGQAAGNSYPR